MKFSEVIGQQQVKNFLINTVKKSRVSHAQLFVGGEGSGKLALAIAYAQFISCTNKQFFDENSPVHGDSCGVCPSCVKYSKLIHPDLHFFFPVNTSKDVKDKPRSELYLQKWREFLLKNNYYVSLNEWYKHIDIENKQGIINAEDCDDIVRKFGLKTYESEYKIIIIWMVEKLYHSAAPKLLKILEEPPENSLFLLVAEKHEQIINTIVSRTQMVKIPKLTHKDITQTLVQRYDANEIQARKIANISDGNLVYARTLLEKDEEELYNMETIRTWLRYCYKLGNDDTIKLSGFIDEFSKIGREKQKNFFIYAMKIVRNSLLAINENENLMRLLDEEKTFVQNFSKVLNQPKIMSFYNELNNAVYHIERNCNPKVLMMDLSIQLHRIMHSKNL